MDKFHPWLIDSFATTSAATCTWKSVQADNSSSFVNCPIPSLNRLTW